MNRQFIHPALRLWVVAGLAVWLGLGLGYAVQAQTDRATVWGIVADSLTKEPLPFANVFIANSTLGVAADAEGKFELPPVPAGVYEVVASFIGHQSATVVVRAEADQRYKVELLLPPQAKQLKEVQVKALSDADWRRCFAIFSKDFLGQTKFSRQAKLRNPTAINFGWDSEQGEVSGSSAEAVVVENLALGYRLHFVLDDYLHQTHQGFSSYVGKPRFEALKPKNAKQARKWASNRAEAYRGSFHHFVKALLADSLVSEGFSLMAIRRGQGMRVTNGKELSRNEVLFTTDQSGLFAIQLADVLQVTYTREPEDPRYAQANYKRASSQQVSNVYLVKGTDYLLIDKSSYVYNPLGAVMQGYWGWEKVAEMLPMDYVPPKSK
jgi:CarboxypepD_reg-like domain